MTIQPIGRESLQALVVRSNAKTLLDFFLVWAVIAGVVSGAHIVGRGFAYALAIIIIGSRQNALATLAHEGWHGILFSSRRLNHFVGAWMYSYPIGILYYHDRDRHLRHHRDVGHDYDPDWINYTNRNRETVGRMLWYLASLLCGRLLFSTLLSFLRRGQPRIGVDSAKTAGDEHRPKVFGELLRVLLCQTVLFGAMTLTTHRWWTYPLLWVLPLASFAGFFANLRALVEHVAERDDVTPEDRLRDIEAGPIERSLIAPSHFNYHALHHAYPAIPHYNLARGKEVCIRKIGYYPFTVQQGYVRCLVAHARKLRSRA